MLTPVAFTMLKRKLDSAVRIAREKGLVGLGEALKRNLLGSDRADVDEVRIVLEVFRDAGIKGVMIDVGAHFGTSAEPFCRDGWQVLAFEPDERNRANLRNRLSQYSNVTIDERALSNEPKESVTFYNSAQSTGISGLSAFDPSHSASGIVAVTTLALACEEQKIPDVDFLKIDTEGFDKFVLDGLPWEKFHPRVIVCEFEDRKTLPLGYSFHDLAGLLAARGYAIVVSEWMPIIRYGIKHSWSRFQDYPCELQSANAWGNLIAVRDERLAQLLRKHCQIAERAYRKVVPSRV